MKMSRLGIVFVVVICLSYGSLVKGSELSNSSCVSVERLYSYMDINRYSKSYHFVDYEAVVRPITNMMLGHSSGVLESAIELITYWSEVCEAKDSEAEVGAWRNLGAEINHMMHTDECVLKIAQILYSDIMGAFFMKPHAEMLGDDLHDDSCYDRLVDTFFEHCGPYTTYARKHIDTFTAMCVLGVNEDAFADAAIQTCQGYFYDRRPPWEIRES